MFRRTDIVLLILTLVLVLFGVVMLSSAGSVVGYSKHNQDSYYFVKHQLLVGVLPGLIAFFVFFLVDYHVWRKLAVPLFVGALILLVFVFIPGFGQSHGRTQSWLTVAWVTFQPVEMMKLAFIFFLALWLEGELAYGGVEALRDTFWPFVFRLGLVAALIAAQPDVGTLAIVVGVACVMYIVAGAPWKHLAIIGGTTIASFVALIMAAPYRLARVLVFLDSGQDPQGIGYHIQQALLGIGSGGVFGVGLGQSRQKFMYLPEVVGDSLFAVIGEELGFVVSVLIVIAFLVFLVRGFRIAHRAPDAFGRLCAVGIVAWIVGQAFLNMGAMLSLVPLTGLPLPFLSFGGTALVMVLAATGMLLNIAKQTRR